ncbi:MULTISPECIES: 1,4-alpha-glucan branching protein GlgB [Aerococcus]|nr:MULTISPECIES: 1,4-alpha-glucan branching protein GlgB [Aerococcus]MDL5183580.1 1,4-alpha-glucan branching protein GlgB [Aerococcus mictus]MDK6291399.1 1,4-alpha-glucan branching protein GlgB [Aerococcus urinae]MDK6375839.1 1,4-alpha-glucan branching protein GlgB [Aerococcus urinae]MDK8075494.1 1,4-alpha-glucan branching protein GlgB [Aerococcus urinae]MDK8085330.1 1,4-alpha-glucan branching protein GlgB [Aerococcus urinae]
MSNQELSIKNIEDNMYFFNKGKHYHAYRFLGAHKMASSPQDGYRFTTWAPQAKSVAIEGDFNQWQPQALERVGETGAWTTVIKEAAEWDLYKFVIEGRDGLVKEKQDPFAFASEVPPKTASVIQDPTNYSWNDEKWLQTRRQKNLYQSPINIYEVHQSSWQRHADGRAYSFDDLRKELIPYVKEMGYTHIEFMPLTEHPLEASWGYQVSGYYSIAGRYGHDFDPLKRFVDAAHQAGIGVIMDWVPGHFVINDDAMANFDGGPTFEYSDPRRAKNIRWGTLNFDLGKNQVQSFLISNAIYWLEEFHFDGLRVDAVSNMLYLDYDEGDWTPNIYGNNVNLEGVDFIRRLNKEIFLRDPSYLMIAEESTAWPGVTQSIDQGGLGFNFKWNMGWMNDTLKFFKLDPLSRSYNYRLITFTFMYMFDENFILPFSHDEVVHGKESLLGKMPGDNRYRQFANLRLMEGYRMVYPGKKLSFMGNEIGQFLEWRFYEGLEWETLSREYNLEFQDYISTLNQLYLSEKALHHYDLSAKGIIFLEADNPDESIVAFIRKGEELSDCVICIFNFTPVERHNYRLGVPLPGSYRILLNSEMKEFGGNWLYQKEIFQTEDKAHQKQDYSIELVLPSLSLLLLVPDTIDEEALAKLQAKAAKGNSQQTSNQLSKFNS